MKTTDALVGFSGFVGSTLLKQRDFAEKFRSTNIQSISGKAFDTVVCAAAPAQKWIANREPGEDRRKVEALISYLDTMSCNTFILVSTVDVFKSPLAVDEDSSIEEEGLHAYGLHRWLLEKYVQNRFEDSLVVRPGLVGPGLRKNVIFDLHNDNNLSAIDSRAVFQFYPMVNLWYDIQTARQAGLKLVHLTAEPVSVAEIARLGFGRDFDNALDSKPAVYDMRTRYADLFGVPGGYQYSKRDTINLVRAYAQSEPVRQNEKRVGEA